MSIGQLSSNGYQYKGEYTQRSVPLQYLRARYVNTQTANFLSCDSFFGSAYEPLTQNRYSAYGNNPIRYSDPSGHAYMTGPGYGGYGEPEPIAETIPEPQPQPPAPYRGLGGPQQANGPYVKPAPVTAQMATPVSAQDFVKAIRPFSFVDIMNRVQNCGPTRIEHRLDGGKEITIKAIDSIGVYSTNPIWTYVGPPQDWLKSPREKGGCAVIAAANLFLLLKYSDPAYSNLAPSPIDENNITNMIDDLYPNIGPIDFPRRVVMNNWGVERISEARTLGVPTMAHYTAGVIRHARSLGVDLQVVKRNPAEFDFDTMTVKYNPGTDFTNRLSILHTKPYPGEYQDKLNYILEGLLSGQPVSMINYYGAIDIDFREPLQIKTQKFEKHWVQIYGAKIDNSGSMILKIITYGSKSEVDFDKLVLANQGRILQFDVVRFEK